MSDYLEFGRVQGRPEEKAKFFVAATKDRYNKAVKSLSKEEVHILRLTSDDLVWLAEQCLLAMNHVDREYTLGLDFDELLEECES